MQGPGNRTVIALLTRLRDVRFVRYMLVSVGALAVDMGSFLALLSLGVIAAGASAVSYSFGILAHWLLSSRTVFHDSVARGGVERTKQKAMFVVSAMLGLALTTAIVGIGDYAGLDLRLAKLVAIGASFTLTWMLRSKLIFRPSRMAD